MNVQDHKLKALPRQPGVYIFRNSAGQVLYVGKAKSLRARVLSYFRDHAALEAPKRQMIQQIADLDTITTDTEIEALVLEANLIRQHQPPYNVVLRDDKYYLFIKITTEQYSRVYPVRRLKRDGARYFGPYSSAAAVRQTIKLLRRIFPHRSEKDLPRETIFPHPLFSTTELASGAAGRHPAPSEIPPAGRSLGEGWRGPSRRLGEAELSEAAGRGPQRQDPPTNYKLNITNIIRFLKGDRQRIKTTLTAGMKAAAARREFERAAIFRDQLRAIERLEGFQKVYLPRRESFDIVSIARTARLSAANVFQIRQGKLLGKNTFLLRHRLPAAPHDVVRQFLLQYYQDTRDFPPAIYLPLALTDASLIAGYLSRTQPPRFAIPERGVKKQLQRMGERNAEQLLTEEQQRIATPAVSRAAVRALFAAIGLPQPHRPDTRIETYDISNIQGQLATGSMVVFINGQPEKNQYRKFRLNSAGQANDYQMLVVVLTRRLAHRTGAGRPHPAAWPLPDLILIDGGRGQLNAARRAIHNAGQNIPLAALAKREETLFIPSQREPIRLPHNSPALYLLQRMRDEAHRFTLSYHQLLRSGHARRSLLDTIPGIGPRTKRRLLNQFGSLQAIRAADATALAKVIGSSRAKSLQDYL
ncbi:MAG: excinuclease ABC subunit C [Candidatus Andersenbacteria bacterium]|nr:excinuclease ABC subunit C [Candidatus Andersenbacteria bacterium]